MMAFRNNSIESEQIHISRSLGELAHLPNQNTLDRNTAEISSDVTLSHCAAGLTDWLRPEKEMEATVPTLSDRQVYLNKREDFNSLLEEINQILRKPFINDIRFKLIDLATKIKATFKVAKEMHGEAGEDQQDIIQKLTEMTSNTKPILSSLHHLNPGWLATFYTIISNGSKSVTGKTMTGIQEIFTKSIEELQSDDQIKDAKVLVINITKRAVLAINVAKSRSQSLYEDYLKEEKRQQEAPDNEEILRDVCIKKATILSEIEQSLLVLTHQYKALSQENEELFVTTKKMLVQNYQWLTRQIERLASFKATDCEDTIISSLAAHDRNKIYTDFGIKVDDNNTQNDNQRSTTTDRRLIKKVYDLKRNVTGLINASFARVSNLVFSIDMFEESILSIDKNNEQPEENLDAMDEKLACMLLADAAPNSERYPGTVTYADSSESDNIELSDKIKDELDQDGNRHSFQVGIQTRDESKSGFKKMISSGIQYLGIFSSSTSTNTPATVAVPSTTIKAPQGYAPHEKL